MKEMSQMHDEDAHDDNLITMEISDHIHTRAQMRAAENAANSHILDTNDLNQDANSSLHMRDDNLVAPTIHEIASLLPTTLPPRATSVNTGSVAPPSVEYDESDFDNHANLADYTELEIAKALARHSVEIGLPKHYATNHLVPEGKMRVVAVKAQKISSQKAVLIVRFISPPSLRNV